MYLTKIKILIKNNWERYIVMGSCNMSPNESIWLNLF